VVNRADKGLEWALKIVTGTKYVYIPYNPDDAFITMVMQSFFDGIPQQGVEMLPASAVTTPEQMAAAVETLPEDTIIFVGLLSANLEAGLDGLVAKADQYDVSIFSTGRGGTSTFPIADFTTTFAGQAEQGAHMVDRILKGAKPASTPVETAEYYLFINLKAAQAYGVEISDEVLKQANYIVR
jgi:putative tryptophan/tyrosine transport system substrate-binding protein